MRHSLVICSRLIIGLVVTLAGYFPHEATVFLENIEKLAHIAIPAVLALALLKDIVRHMIGKSDSDPPAHEPEDDTKKKVVSGPRRKRKANNKVRP